MWFTNDSVDAILKAFMVLIRRLDTIAKAREARNIELHKEEDNIRVEINKNRNDADRAMRVANKLRELVE